MRRLLFVLLGALFIANLFLRVEAVKECAKVMPLWACLVNRG